MATVGAGLGRRIGSDVLSYVRELPILAISGLKARVRGNRIGVPLYCCRACGFATTASWRNAVTAHDVGSPHCPGELEMTVSFSGRPPDSDVGHERMTGKRSAGARHDPAVGPAQDPA